MIGGGLPQDLDRLSLLRLPEIRNPHSSRLWLNALLGKPVEVRATPFGRFTRHHLTLVLLHLESVKELKAAKP